MVAEGLRRRRAPKAPRRINSFAKNKVRGLNNFRGHFFRAAGWTHGLFQPEGQGWTGSFSAAQRRAASEAIVGGKGVKFTEKS